MNIQIEWRERPESLLKLTTRNPWRDYKVMSKSEAERFFADVRALAKNQTGFEYRQKPEPLLESESKK